MIAPLREPESRRPTSPLVLARRLVVATLMSRSGGSGGDCRVPTWKAWLLAVVVVVMVAVYLAYRFGLLTRG